MIVIQIRATIELWEKEKWFLAKIPELDFLAQGRTREEAKSNLQEVVKIQFAEMREMGTLEEYLAECGFFFKGDYIEQEKKMVGLEQDLLQVA
jgi:predicted RNase H-like HicB family nuclease